MNRREYLRGSVGLPLVGVAGCLENSAESDVQDSDGDGVIDSQDYAPSDPDVQAKSDVQGDTGQGGDNTGDGGQEDSSAGAQAQDSETGTDPDTQSEPEQTVTDSNTQQLECSQEVSDTVSVEAQEAKIYDMDLPKGSRVRLTVKTEDGKEPVLTVTAPSGQDLIDGKSEALMREQFTATEAGSHVVRLENGAIAVGDVGVESGRWTIEMDVCTPGGGQ